MFNPTLPALSFAVLLHSALASAQVTAAAQLAPRQADPAFVGYISSNGGYSNPRSCDYPQTVSTSGAYVQCCPATGACPFYTACSSNTLLGAGTAVPCDYNPSLTCNTGIVLSTAGANSGPSYLACWQTTLGSPFTFVQNIGSATVAGSTGATSTGTAMSGSTARSSSAASSSSASSSASRTSSSGSSSAASTASAASSAASSAAKNVANSMGDLSFGGIVGGAFALLGQALL